MKGKIMAYDDMEVIMYKILAYLYKCNKAGKDTDFPDYCAGGVLIKMKTCYTYMQGT
ncbi:MAG: hypothetical protein ACOX4I_00375 [Anaerovoracaceae bacterium]